MKSRTSAVSSSLSKSMQSFLRSDYFPYVVKKLRPNDGPMTEPILAGESGLGEAAQHRPLLVATGNDDLYLRSEIQEEIVNHSIEYEIHMVDSDDVQTPLSGKADLYIPYPEGMDMESAAQYDVTIHHTTEQGDEVFSTQDGTITLTPYGFQISVSSLSPFKLSWSPSSSDLPRTGDSSRLILWMTLCMIALITQNKVRKTV